MLWIIPAWILSLVAIFVLGFYIRGLAKKIVELDQEMKTKVNKKPEPTEPQSQIIDPYDPVAEAVYQHRKMMEKINE